MIREILAKPTKNWNESANYHLFNKLKDRPANPSIKFDYIALAEEEKIQEQFTKVKDVCIELQDKL